MNHMNHTHPSMPGKIVSVREDIRWGDCTLYGIVDGKEQRLFNYYIDEIGFSKNELIGLTPGEAIELKFQKDLQYIRS
jgi:hypothetical protein